MNAEPIQSHMTKLFTEGFTAVDIAECLPSFDADKSSAYVRQFMSDKRLEVVGVRHVFVSKELAQANQLKRGAIIHNVSIA
jgi:hypothetical protein